MILLNIYFVLDKILILGDKLMKIEEREDHK